MQVISLWVKVKLGESPDRWKLGKICGLFGDSFSFGKRWGIELDYSVITSETHLICTKLVVFSGSFHEVKHRTQI